MRKFTAAEREKIRRQEAKLLENIDKLPPERQLIAQIAARGRRIEKAKKAKVPEVGLFFVVNGKLWVEGIRWTENPSYAGFRTSAVGHPDYWQQLQRIGAVPKDMPYDEAASVGENHTRQCDSRKEGLASVRSPPSAQLDQCPLVIDTSCYRHMQANSVQRPNRPTGETGDRPSQRRVHLGDKRKRHLQPKGVQNGKIRFHFASTQI